MDNTRPRLVVRAVRLAKPRRAHARAGAGARAARRQARLIVAAADAGTTGALLATVDLRTASGRTVSLRRVKVKPGPMRAIALGRLSPGRYRVRIDLRDRAGNPAVVTRTVRVR